MENSSLSRSFLIFLFLLGAAFALLAISFYALDDHQAVSLAELTSHGESVGGVSMGVTEFLRSAGKSLESVDLSSILYSIAGLGIFGLLLRVIQVAISTGREEGYRRLAQPSDQGELLSTEPVGQTPPPRPALRSVKSTEALTVPEEQPSPAVGPVEKELHLMSLLLWERFRFFRGSLTGKMVFTFTGIVAGFGLMTMAIVYLTLRAALWEHAIERGKVVAVNISDTLAPFLLAKDSSETRAVLRRQATKSGAAYALVQDRAGRLLAHSFAAIPQEVQILAPIPVTRDKGGRSFQLGKSMVYEISVPILEGQIGAARVGIWEDDVNAEIGEMLAPVLKLITLVVIAGILLAVFLVRRINRPIMRLISSAERISHGDLDVPSIGTDDRSEFGELSRALERLRSSVRAAMIRLGAE